MPRPPISPPARVLRARLLAALGLGASALPGCLPNCPPIVTYVLSLDGVAADTGTDTAGDTAEEPYLTECPTDTEAVQELMVRNEEGCSVQELLSVAQDERLCTYELTCMACCGYGRPYLDERGQPLEADTQPSAAWAVGVARPDLSRLSAWARGELGRRWLENARAEHSSVAGFQRFALDLLAHGAPPELVGRAIAAGAQELRHATDCFTLASAYLGAPVGPAPMPLGARAPIACNLAQLAGWTARDGAVGETLAAWLAGRALERCTDPAVRHILADIAREETDHAELAWATLRWALEQGGEEAREAVVAVFRGIPRPALREAAWTPALGEHGVLEPETEKAAAEACIREVILPLAGALLTRVGRAA